MASLNNWKIDIWMISIAVLFGIVTVIYLSLRRIYTYWDRRGFKTFPNYNYIFGHLQPTFTQTECASDNIKRIYNSTNDPFIGIYGVLRPILLVRDPELIQSILKTDVAHFLDRDVHCNEKYDPLSGHLFALTGQRWKNLRGKLTPAFTSGKLKAMFSTILKSGANVQNYLEKLEQQKELFDVRNTSLCMTIDVIASVAFGLEVDSINDRQNGFFVAGTKMIESSIMNSIRLTCHFVAPKLMSFFRIKLNAESVDKFMRNVVKENVEYREKNKIIRKDLFQLLIQIRNNGTVQLDDEWETVIQADENQKTLSLDEIAAQTFIFFSAGFETSSATMAFLMYEISKNQAIQKRLHDEIDRVLAEHDRKITFESISAMKYLSACIDETLRRHPQGAILNRSCVQDYHIPGTDKVIEKGTQVFIPVSSLQMDEKYYEDPDTFDPDRFASENLVGKDFLNRPYLPFGDGPRKCVGPRLAKINMKVGLIMMLQKYRYELDDSIKNLKRMDYDPKQFLNAPRHTILLKIIKRN